MTSSKRRVLTPPSVLKTFACIGSQSQTTGMLRVADGAEERRQQLEDVPGAHPRDERQAAGHPRRVEPLAELERLVRGRRRAELDRERVVDAGEELDVRAVDAARPLADPEQVAPSSRTSRR